MKRPRYPYADAGKVAAAVFSGAGVIVGGVLALVFTGPAGIVPSAAVWAVLAGVIAYMVFASQGPARPSTVWQGVVADGIIAGILSGFLGALVGIILSSGHGSPYGHAPSPGAGAILLIAGVVCGAAVGGLIGPVVLAIGGVDRLARVPVSARKAKRLAGKKRRETR